MRKKIIIGSIIIIVIGLFIGFNIAKNQSKPASTASFKTVQLASKEITSKVMTLEHFHSRRSNLFIQKRRREA